jgi:hypothetical protein
VWITRQEAISIYARYFRVRFGVTARNMAVERAHQLKRKGDIEGVARLHRGRAGAVISTGELVRRHPSKQIHLVDDLKSNIQVL